ncbi:hypothetical protein C4580_02405 [Candidatus Woesearchaeota archaeon]|nr:MAG: hypothetical protein C4580_02405 [Candidatus Woesearchaeota archaeon]
MNIMLDTNIYDKLAEDQAVLQQIETAIAKGVVCIFTTHIQEDEIDALNKKGTKPQVVKTYVSLTKKKVPTAGFVLDVSRLDEACLGGVNTKVAGPHGTHVKDALIATTTDRDSCTLVTENKTDFKYVKYHDFEAFKKLLQKVLAPKDEVLNIKSN